MADLLNLTNFTLVESSSFQQVTNRINFLVNLFQALGGIFVAWLIITYWNLIKYKRQIRVLKEINQRLIRIEKKFKIKPKKFKIKPKK